jgi:hypothetical protein
MAKKPKLVAPAPKVALPEPEPELTPFERLAKIWLRRKTAAQKVLDDFRAAMVPDPEGKPTSIVHYIEWNTEKVMRAEAFLFLEVRGMDELLSELAPVEGGIWRAKERLETAFDKVINDLTGLNLGGGGEGPWRHNGSSALHNVNNLAKCDAKREALALFREMLEVIEELEGTAPAP